jgi:hypothetical protein
LKTQHERSQEDEKEAAAKRRKTRVAYWIPGIILLVSCEEEVYMGCVSDTGDTCCPAKRRRG